jgi:hypothetical protein
LVAVEYAAAPSGHPHPATSNVEIICGLDFCALAGF